MAIGRNTSIARGIVKGIRTGVNSYKKSKEKDDNEEKRKLKLKILREQLRQLLNKRKSNELLKTTPIEKAEYEFPGYLSSALKESLKEKSTVLPKGIKQGAIPQYISLLGTARKEQEGLLSREEQRKAAISAIQEEQKLGREIAIEEKKASLRPSPRIPFKERLAEREEPNFTEDERRRYLGIEEKKYKPPPLRERITSDVWDYLTREEKARYLKVAPKEFKPDKPLSPKDKMLEKVYLGEDISDEEKVILGISPTKSKMALMKAKENNLKKRTEGEIKANAIQQIELVNLKRMGFKSVSDAASTFSKIMKTVQNREEFDFLKKKTMQEASQNWIEFLSEESRKGRKGKRDDLNLMLDYLDFERKKTKNEAEITADKERARINDEELNLLKDKFKASRKDHKMEIVTNFEKNFVFKSGKPISIKQAENIVKTFYTSGYFPENIVSKEEIRDTASLSPKPVSQKDIIKATRDFMDFYEKPGNKPITSKEAEKVARTWLSGTGTIPEEWVQKDKNRIKNVSVRNTSLVKLNSKLEFLDILADGVLRDFEKGAYAFVGPITAAAAAMKRPLNLNPYEVEAFTVKTNELFNYFTKEISGSQVTGNEILRMFKQLPSVFNASTNFKAKIYSLRESIRIQIQKNNDNIENLLGIQQTKTTVKPIEKTLSQQEKVKLAIEKASREGNKEAVSELMKMIEIN